MKQTRQKTLILEQVLNRNDHPTAEMIHHELLLIDSHISLATVYRNLNTFAMKGKIRKIEIPNAKDRFDWKINHHDHALCLCCGNIFDVESKPIRKRQINLENFKIKEVKILYKGICNDCQNTNKA